MNKTKLRIILVLIVLLAAMVIIFRQGQRVNDLSAEAAAIRGQTEQAESLKAENQRLADQLQAAAERSHSDSNDLAQLRTQAGAMRQTEQENARLKSEVKKLRKAADVKAAEEFDGRAALHWVTAVLTYAHGHQGQFPTSLQDVVPLLPEEFSPELAPKIAATADRYELMYQGTLDGLTNPPPEAAIIIRAKQPWQNTNGGWTKEYGIGQGSGLFHNEPDGNFDKFESTRIPKSTGR